MLENLRKRDNKLVKVLSIVTILSVICCITLIVTTAHKPDNPEFCMRCHKDDIDRYFDADIQRGDSLSWTVSFSHSEHSEQNLSCRKCHSISHKSEVGIVEYGLNCSKCHHISENKRGCIDCHKEPSEYLMGTAGVVEIAFAPDTMSRAVKCEDCHKYNEGILKFKGVEEYCVECHNSDYGRLYNAWTKTIEDRLNGFSSRVQLLVESVIKVTGKDMGNEGKSEELIDMDIFLEETGKTVDLITRYGTHNFNLTISILDNLEAGLEALE